jgi:hypothetical protein
MPTPAEIQKNLDALYEDFLNDFQPLYSAVIELKRLMFKRIFGTGNKGGTNAAGTNLPTKGYSTKSIYVSSKSIQDAPSKFKVGKRGEPIKSLFFPEGYNQLKTQTSRNLPLELTGNLKGAFQDSAIIAEGLTSGIALPESESGKVKGLETKYGPIFVPTAEEQAELLEDHAQLLVEQIIKAMNKR